MIIALQEGTSPRRVQQHRRILVRLQVLGTTQWASGSLYGNAQPNSTQRHVRPGCTLNDLEHPRIRLSGTVMYSDMMPFLIYVHAPSHYCSHSSLSPSAWCVV